MQVTEGNKKKKKRLDFIEFYLKVLVVMRIDAKTGDKAVHHQLHISILAACCPPERLGRIEQQSLVVDRERKDVRSHLSRSWSTQHTDLEFVKN